MYLDDQLTFAKNVAAFAGVGSALIGVAKTLDGSQIGAASSQRAQLLIQVSTAFVGAGTPSFEWRSGANAGAVLAGQVHARTPLYTIAQLSQSARIIMELPIQPFDPALFFGLVCVNTGITTAGAINAFFVLDAQTWQPTVAITGSVA